MPTSLICNHTPAKRHPAADQHGEDHPSSWPLQPHCPWKVRMVV